MNGLIKKIRKEKPIVHCLTNYVTVNDCANLLIAAGASPIMADAKEEMSDMVELASSVCINIGTLNARTFESMLIAGKEANRLHKPVVFDPVGVGAMFHTATKTDAKLVDFAALQEICQAVSIPIVAIGGITKDNMQAFVHSGIDGVAVISTILAETNIMKATSELKEKITAIVGGNVNEDSTDNSRK